jgi:Zn-finger nucleic acid-binding protein
MPAQSAKVSGWRRGNTGLGLSGTTRRQRKRGQGQPDAETSLAVANNQHAKLCPDCQVIMLRYQVGRGLSFAIDQCSRCAGLWFDQNEWETLKASHLHDEIHRILTAPWQSQVRKEEARQHLEAVYARRFGSDYAEIKRMKAWLDAHPEKPSILAFFNDPHPFDE